MTFEVEIDDRTHLVSVENVGAAGPAGGAFRLLLDGTSYQVTCRRTDLGLSIVFDDGRVVDVAATDLVQGEWLLQFPHIDLTAVVDRRRRERGRPGAAAGEGEQRLTAPMPGRVVRILVKTGDEVAARQGLVVVEAMKMENELVSPKAGRVKDVAVAEGESVDAGRLLVVVE